MSAPRRVSPEARRRGWCPSLLRPMPTGDGLLARVHPPLGRLTSVQARAVAQGARRFGNGHIDVTARANLQIRGVTPETQGSLAESLEAVGLGDIRDDGGPQRLTLTAPCARHDVIALAEAVEAVGRTIPDLPAKTLVALEAEDRFGLAGAEADVSIRLLGDDSILLALAEAEGQAWYGPLAAAQMAVLLSDLLRTLAQSGARRMRDLPKAERGGLVARLGLTPCAAPPVLPHRPPGLREAEGALALNAPFGRCTAVDLEALAAWSDSLGSDLQVSPTRGFVLATNDADIARRARDALAHEGFLTEENDPRNAVAACPGAPACASGSTPTLADAARLAEALEPFRAPGAEPFAHVSGCAKGCAHPGAAPLTLVGADGLYGIVLDGRPDALPAMRLTFEAALERLRRADPRAALAHAFTPHEQTDRNPA